MVALPLASAAGRKKLNGIHRFLGEGHDWDLELVRNEQAFIPQIVADARRNGFDGILSAIIEDANFAHIHEKIGIPTVFIDYPNIPLIQRFPYSVFINDDTAAIAKAAVRHFLSRPGIQSFGFVPARIPSRWSNDRRDAFVRALDDAGRRTSVFKGNGESREDLEKWLLGLTHPAAVLAAFDDRARDVLEVCRKNKISVPERISVLGIGNDETICEMASPALTSIAVDFEMEGYKAARELQAMMLRNKTPVKRVILCGIKDVVFRASTTASRMPNAIAERAMAFIEKHAVEGITAKDVIRHLKISRSLANMRFKEEKRTTILEAILTTRLEAVKRLLKTTNLRISEVAWRCGYKDANYLKNLFRKRTGMSMREYRNGPGISR